MSFPNKRSSLSEEEEEKQMVTVSNELLDKMLMAHGRVATMEKHDMTDTFESELNKEGISYEEYQEAYVKVSNFASKGYEDLKDLSNMVFIRQFISEIKEVMDAASEITKLETE